MRIKKFKNNEYLLAEDDVWVRNPFGTTDSFDINNLNQKDLKLFIENEYQNAKVYGMHFDEMSEEEVDNITICSDGYKWKDLQKTLGKMPNKLVKIIGVNGSLAKWEMVGEKADIKRIMSFYLVNNPYSECMGYLPRKHKYFPNLIASIKTNPKFIKNYNTQPYFYRPTSDLVYSGILNDNYLRLDDYRNPICAAISFALKKKVKKLALFCCDEAFSDEKPGAVKMKNGLYQYPQQIMCQKIIDKQLFWLKKAGVQVVDCSAGIEYENAEYIDSEDLLSYFEDSDE